MCLLELFRGTGKEGGGPLKWHKHEPIWGNFCWMWDVQMRQNGVTMERRIPL